jgi:fermentation-respiration switch protein FrsA (DUF1100 family)
MQNELPFRRWSSFGILHFALCVCLLMFTGCSVAGIFAYKVLGPPKIDEKYKPAKTPMLVLAENRRQPSATVGAEELSAFVIEELTEHDVAPMIPAEKLQELRDSKLSQFYSMSVTAVGKAVGAAQVLYIQFDRDDITPLTGGETLQGTAQVHVKVVDVASGRTLWPEDASSGYPLGTSSSLGKDPSSQSVTDVQRRMYATLAGEIAKLFYKWQPEFQTPE